MTDNPQNPASIDTDNEPIPLHRNGSGADAPEVVDESAQAAARAREAAAAATVALRCDSCGRRPGLPKELSARLKSTNGPAAFDSHGGVYRMPIFCDECFMAMLILVRRTAGVIRPETDITTVVMAQ